MARKKRIERENEFLKEHRKGKAAAKCLDKRHCRAVACFSLIPCQINGTCVSENEWPDNVRLRYNLEQLEIPQTCDGCGAPMTH